MILLYNTQYCFSLWFTAIVLDRRASVHIYCYINSTHSYRILQTFNIYNLKNERIKASVIMWKDILIYKTLGFRQIFSRFKRKNNLYYALSTTMQLATLVWWKKSLSHARSLESLKHWLKGHSVQGNHLEIIGRYFNLTPKSVCFHILNESYFPISKFTSLHMKQFYSLLEKNLSLQISHEWVRLFVILIIKTSIKS